MEKSNKNNTIENLINSIVGRTKGITSEQIELARELYIDDPRSIEEIKIALQEYAASIIQINNIIPMKKQETPDMYALDIPTQIKGIYLGETQIDLMTITELSDTNELAKFITECEQLNYSQEELTTLYKMKLSIAKRKVFEDYRRTLIGTDDMRRDPTISLRHKVISLGLSNDVADEIVELYKDGKREEIINYITTNLNLDLATITAQTFGKHSIDYDDVKCSSYEEIEALAKKVSEFDSVTLISGKYQLVMNGDKFDPYHIKRELDFCKRHDIQVRYHSLLTKDLLEYFSGKSKEEIKEKLRTYVSDSVDFITQYNTENKLSDGMPVIRSVDIFNELINLKKDKTSEVGYYNAWEKLGLTAEDIVDVFAPAIGKRPEGVEYVYNEAFVETAEKRVVQLNLAKEIKELAPDLIDVFGTQMHITTDFTRDTIESTFNALKKFSDETGIKLAITEFDMYVPAYLLKRLKQARKSKYEIESYVTITKLAQLKNISQVANETGIVFDEVSYWSITDSMDHNKRRHNLEQNKSNQTEDTLYGGLFGHSLQPKALREVVDYTREYVRPSEVMDVANYVQDLTTMLNKQPVISPQHKQTTEKSELPKTLVKVNEQKKLLSNEHDDSGFANFPQLLMLTLILVALLYILLM